MLVIAVACEGDKPAPQTPTESKARIGIYDSRAVAAAFAGSEPFKAAFADVQAQHAEAKAAGNEKRMADLEAQMEDQQDRLHQQAFGTASVDDILLHIADKLSAIEADAGVDALVSKWDQGALAKHPNAEQVDVTMALVDALGPTDSQRARAIQIQKTKP